jgi:hypothetical protein
VQRAAHLQALGISALDVHPDPVRIATEGALCGSLAAQGLLRGTVIVSDGAGQFKLAQARAGIGDHALCWVHAERLVHKLDAFTADRQLARRGDPGPHLGVLRRSESLCPRADARGKGGVGDPL